MSETNSSSLEGSPLHVMVNYHETTAGKPLQITKDGITAVIPFDQDRKPLLGEITFFETKHGQPVSKDEDLSRLREKITTVLGGS